MDLELKNKKYRDYILQLFRQGPSEIKPLNGIRAISMLLIIACHIWVVVAALLPENDKPEIVKHFMENLVSGVDLFFILSGFLIYKILYTEYSQNQKIDFKKFFLKRSFRIFPIYYFFLILTFLISQLTVFAYEKKGSLSNIDQFVLYEIKEHISLFRFDFLYISNFFNSFHPHTWSLSVEEQFYLIFPFLSVFLLHYKRIRRLQILTASYFLPLIFRIVFYYDIFGLEPSELILHNSILTRFDSLIVGIFLYEIYLWFLEDKRPIPYIKLFLPVSFFGLIALHSFSFDKNVFHEVFHYNILHIGFFMIAYSSIIRKSFWSDFLSSNFWTPLARLSYSIYLWHILIFGGIFGKTALSTKTDGNIFYFVSSSFKGFAITIIIALISYAIIEVPFFMVRDKLTDT